MRALRSVDGSVALETALVAPVVALLVVGVLGMTSVATDQLAAERTARATARAVAVTGSPGDPLAALPTGARVVVDRGGRAVTVVVTVPGRIAGLGYEARAVATAALEPGVP